MRALLPGLVVACLAAFASAQVIGPEVGVTGVVMPTPGPLGCGPATHMLMCTQVFLAGDVALLQSLVGKNVKLFGHEELLPGATCTLIEVESVADPPPATLDWCGSATPGCDLRFVICPGGLSQYWLWVAAGNGYHALAPAKGSWLLGDPAFLVATGIGGAACLDLDVKVPVDPGILGVTLYLQAARRDIGPIGPAQLTNSICLTIQPSTMPCVPPGC